jgi:hypothetical protein
VVNRSRVPRHYEAGFHMCGRESFVQFQWDLRLRFRPKLFFVFHGSIILRPQRTSAIAKD